MNARLDDRQYRDAMITEVRAESDGSWSITADDGWSFWVPPTAVTPRVGATVRFYGAGIGSPVRGCSIDGVEIFYRTAEQEEERHRDESARWRIEKRDAFQHGGRIRLDADYAALPETFQRRIDGFRARGGDGWRIDHEPYEMSVCVDGARIARALGSAAAVWHFHGLEYEEQKTLVPGLFDGHSGNSLGMACRLAIRYLTDEALVVQEHGALCNLVGCNDYSCRWAQP